MKRIREELESLKKEGKDTLVAENEQLKADNLTIQKGEGCFIKSHVDRKAAYEKVLCGSLA